MCVCVCVCVCTEVVGDTRTTWGILLNHIYIPFLSHTLHPGSAVFVEPNAWFLSNFYMRMAVSVLSFWMSYLVSSLDRVCKLLAWISCSQQPWQAKEHEMMKRFSSLTTSLLTNWSCQEENLFIINVYRCNWEISTFTTCTPCKQLWLADYM